MAIFLALMKKSQTVLIYTNQQRHALCIDTITMCFRKFSNVHVNRRYIVQNTD